MSRLALIIIENVVRAEPGGEEIAFPHQEGTVHPLVTPRP